MGFPIKCTFAALTAMGITSFSLLGQAASSAVPSNEALPLPPNARDGEEQKRELYWNSRLTQMARGVMPQNGGYSTGPRASAELRRSFSMKNGRLQVTPSKGPSFCSAATYTLLIKAAEESVGRLPGKERLLPSSQPDGTGIWGRWNSNGPGTAVLFAESGAGFNFTDWNRARPGDFLKIWWTDAVGKNERGHLVLFLERQNESLTFWSCNQSGGYGIKTVPLKKIRHALFSRLTNPEKLLDASLSDSNGYLASMLRKDTTWQEVLEKSQASK